MLPQSPNEEPRNSSRVNLLISFAFHAAIVVALVFFAAREGFLGKQLKKITVQMVREKPVEKPKEPEKPKETPPEPPKVPPREVALGPKTEAPPPARLVPPPTAIAPASVAPPVVETPSFVFDGARTVQTSSDPVQLYKGSLEYALLSKWNRPGDAPDDHYVDEVEVSVNRAGDISDPTMKKVSGDARWDASVLAAIAAVKSLERPPPADFPARVVVRFDVEETEAITQ